MLSTLRRKLRLSIHPDIIDKSVPEAVLYAEGWENVELTPEELAQSVKSGRPYCAQVYGYRDARHFKASDIVSLDVEAGPTIEQALQHPLVQAHATLVYTTPNRRPSAPRFRMVFALPRTITDPREMAAIVRALRLRVFGDRKAVDPARLFFGNTKAEIMLFDREISPALLDELIAQGLNPPEADTNHNGGSRWVPSRSGLPIRRDQQIRLAKGGTASFSDLGAGTSIHCPFHNDRHPSGFVVTSQAGVNGVFCSACGCTYWPENSSPPGDEALESFEKAIRDAAAYNKNHETNGSLDPLFGFLSAGETGSTVHVVTGQATPPALLLGHMMVHSPKGTGKTTRLTSLLRNSSSVLLIGHRRALIRQTCERLKLHCYLDDYDEPNLEQYSRYGVCLDSLAKIPRESAFDILVLDESEQVLAHFLSETMDRGGGSRDRVFVEFRRLVHKAKTVIALDADLGWVTFRTLSRLAPKQDKHVWLNEANPGEGKKIEIYDSQQHLIAELKQALADGKRCFVTSNAKGKVAKLAAAIRDEFPQKHSITITSDTGEEEPVKEFVSNPRAAAMKYDVVFASPSIGTGVDITFPDKAQVFDFVFGFCEAQITTHLEFDQQLSRVRHPGEVKVWVNPRRFNFETEFDVVKRDALERSLFKNLLIDYDDTGEPQYQENDPFLEMASLIVSEHRLSKNSLRANFIRHKEKQGFLIEYIRKDGDSVFVGKSILAKGKRLDDETYSRAILSAKSLAPAEYDSLTESLIAGERLSAAERLAYEKATLERFYHEPVSEELVRLDQRGRYRTQVRLFETVFGDRHLIEWNLRLLGRNRFATGKTERAAALQMLLRLTPLLNDEHLNPEVIIEGSDLHRFAEFALEKKALIETHLGLEVRRDVTSKPVQQLGRILRLVGLRLEPLPPRKEGGRKVYSYRLEPGAPKENDGFC